MQSQFTVRTIFQLDRKSEQAHFSPKETRKRLKDMI